MKDYPRESNSSYYDVFIYFLPMENFHPAMKNYTSLPEIYTFGCYAVSNMHTLSLPMKPPSPKFFVVTSVCMLLMCGLLAMAKIHARG